MTPALLFYTVAIRIDILISFVYQRRWHQPTGAILSPLQLQPSAVWNYFPDK